MSASNEVNGPNGLGGLSEERVWEALKQVRFPGMSRDIVSFGFVKQVRIDGGAVRVKLAITTQNRAAAEEVQKDVQRAVAALPGALSVAVEVEVAQPPTREESAAKAIAPNPHLIPEVRSV